MNGDLYTQPIEGSGSAWTRSTEAEARQDIGRKYSQIPSGKIVDFDIGRIETGAVVFGKESMWRIGLPPAEKPIPAWGRCPACDYRSPEQFEVCSKCGAVAGQGSLL